jgi:hypothetical protein
MNSEAQNIKSNRGFNLSKLKKDGEELLTPNLTPKQNEVLNAQELIIQKPAKEKKKVGRKALKEEDKKEYKAVCYLTSKDAGLLQEIANEEEEGDLSKLFRKIVKNYLKQLNKI